MKEKTLNLTFEKTTVAVVDDDEQSDEQEDTESTTPLPEQLYRDKGLALLEQYGVFGAAPGSWTSRCVQVAHA